MKAAIIILGNQWVCPYVNTYRRIFDKLGCSYDVILWDRDGSDVSAPIRYSSGNADLDNPIVKTFHYVRYADFIKKTISENGYDRLVVSGPHLAILLSGVLRNRYKGRYVIDYRDISVEQRLLLRGVYSKVLESSFCNVISSPGFKKHLPRKYDYLVSHNFDHNAAINALNGDFPLWKAGSAINVLTIGYIRNYDSNVRIIQALGGDEGYRLKFVGRGEAAPSLESYVRANGLDNVEFSGFYEKKDEAMIVGACDFINIFFPNDVVHSAIMSNRFYLALIHKKPVIVTEGSVQAAFVKEYGLGVVTDGGEGLSNEIGRYLSTFDYAGFCSKCNELLAVFVKEHQALERALACFVR